MPVLIMLSSGYLMAKTLLRSRSAVEAFVTISLLATLNGDSDEGVSGSEDFG